MDLIDNRRTPWISCGQDIDSRPSDNVLSTPYPQRAGVPVINKTTGAEKKDLNSFFDKLKKIIRRMQYYT